MKLCAPKTKVIQKQKNVPNFNDDNETLQLNPKFNHPNMKVQLIPVKSAA